MDRAKSFLLENLSHCEYWHDIKSVLTVTKNFKYPVNLESLQIAFDYGLNFDQDQDSQPYVPMFESDKTSYPSQLRDISNQIKTDWLDLRDYLIDSPIALSRLADLLWVTKSSSESHLFAREAHQKLNDIVRTSNWSNIYKMSAARRAMNLARELQDIKLQEQSSEVFGDLIRHSLNSSDREPGVYLPLIDDLLENDETFDFNELNVFLETAQEKLLDDPFNTDHVLRLKIFLHWKNNDRVLSLQLERIKLWEDAAEASSGFVRLTHLEKARELASRYKELEEVERLSVKIENSAGQAKSEMVKLTATIEIPRADIDKYLENFTRYENLSDNLKAIANHCPIQDKVESRKFIEQMMAEHPLQFTFSKIIVDSNGLPLRHVKGFSDHLDAELTSLDTRRIILWGDFVIQLFDRLLKDVPTSIAAIAEIINSSPFIEDNDFERIMSAFNYYFEKKYDESSHLLMARLEKILRKILRDAGRQTYRQPSDAKLGQYFIMSQLMNGLIPLLDDNLHTYINNIMCNPESLNLRNLIYHGLKIHTTQLEAALLLHLSLLICLLRPIPNQAESK
jgi:hypothetical protein